MKDFASRKTLKLTGSVLWLVLAACSENQPPDDAPSHEPGIVRVKTAAQALEGAHIPALDPSTMNGAEIRKVIGTGPHCTFRYTSTGRPVAVVGLDQSGSPAAGVIKLNGSLVPLEPDAAATRNRADGFVLVADPVRLSVQPSQQAADSEKQDEGRVGAEMLFEVGQELKVGYGGYMDCRATPAAPASVQ